MLRVVASSNLALYCKQFLTKLLLGVSGNHQIFIQCNSKPCESVVNVGDFVSVSIMALHPNPTSFSCSFFTDDPSRNVTNTCTFKWRVSDAGIRVLRIVIICKHDKEEVDKSFVVIAGNLSPSIAKYTN